MLIVAMILLFGTIFFITIEFDKHIRRIEDKAARINYVEDDTCEHDSEIFCSELPLILIETKGNIIKKEEIIWSSISIINNEFNSNHLEDIPEYEVSSTIKYRGNSSYANFDKKQYKLELFKEKNSNKQKDIPVLGMKKESDWILNGPYLDRTLIRNKLVYDFSKEIIDWAPDTRYCEVFINGEYQGLYLMIESIKIGENRLNSKNFSLLDGETPYLLQRERPESEQIVINNYGTYTGKTAHELSIHYPKEKNIIESQKEWIRRDISEFERVLYSDVFDDDEIGYESYINVDSFVDYYIINEFTMIRDAGYLSTYIYKDLGGKIKIIPWDFNDSFENYQWYKLEIEEFLVNNNNWFKRLFNDSSFTEKVVKRYRELRTGVLSEENLLRKIDKNIELMGPAIERNFQVWGYSFQSHLIMDSNGISYDPKSYEEAIQQLKTTIILRGNFLDKNIEYLYKYAIN